MSKKYTEEEIDELVLAPSSPKKSRGVTKTNTSPGDNRKFLQMALESFELTPVDFEKPETVNERIKWYFERCCENDVKPTVSGLANALGRSRKDLWAIKVGERRSSQPEIRSAIEHAYQVMEEMWENYMLNGKVNPVSGIFLGKNNFGYTDKQEVVLTPNNPLGELESADKLRERYEDIIIEDEYEE